MDDRQKVVFTIDGEPRGKGRPRFSSMNGKSRAITPEQTVIYENLVKMMYRYTCGSFSFGEGVQLDLRIFAYYGIPKSASKAKRADMIAGKIRPKKKPDMDNIVKIIADALNGIAYHDDAQIVDTMVRKFYSEQPHVDVMIALAE